MTDDNDDIEALRDLADAERRVQYRTAASIKPTVVGIAETFAVFAPPDAEEGDETLP